MPKINMESYYIVTFASTHQAIRFEKVIKGEGIDLTLLPVPRRLSSSCGIAARFLPGDFTRIKELIERKGLLLNRIYLFYREKEKKGEKILAVEINTAQE